MYLPTASEHLTCLGVNWTTVKVRSRVGLRCRELGINLNVIPDTYDTVGIWWSMFFGPHLILNFQLSVKNLPVMQEAQVRSLSQEDPLEKEMAAHSSILAWKIPWTEEPGRLQSMGSQRVGHDWATKQNCSHKMHSVCSETTQTHFSHHWIQSRGYNNENHRNAFCWKENGQLRWWGCPLLPTSPSSRSQYRAQRVRPSGWISIHFKGPWKNAIVLKILPMDLEKVCQLQRQWV